MNKDWLISALVSGYALHNPIIKVLEKIDGAAVKVEKPILSTSPEAAEKGADFSLCK